jgi:uncharacterized repeat protein (TIGR03803 family)
MQNDADFDAMIDFRLLILPPITALPSALIFALLPALLVAFTSTAYAQTEKVIHSFCSKSNCADGAFPVSNLISDAEGNLYGTTTSGGSAPCPSYGCGAVFEITK